MVSYKLLIYSCKLPIEELLRHFKPKKVLEHPIPASDETNKDVI